MRKVGFVILFLLFASISFAQVPNEIYMPHPVTTDSLFHTGQTKKKLLLSCTEVLSLNMLIWGDDYISGEPFAKINMKTMGDNLKAGFLWDNDNMATNMFMHPYNGSYYFTIARSNGYNFWESVPFTAGGSLIWELFLENQPPSTNDFLATTFGGAMLGEILFRLSHSVYDDTKRGRNRVFREIAGFVLSPMTEFNRVVSGEAFKVRPDKSAYVKPKVPIHFDVNLGGRFISDKGNFVKGSYGVAFGFHSTYGDPFLKTSFRPYDWFNFGLEFNVGGHQPVLNSANAVGLIYGKHIHLLWKKQMVFGIYQHFNFYNSDPAFLSYDRITPYQVAEAVSFGPGLMYKSNSGYRKIQLTVNSYASLVLLGASYTDHLQLPDRKYNMGQGFSLNLNAVLNFRPYIRLGFNLYDLMLFTWKGYPLNQDLTQLTTEQLNYLNTEGDKGNSNILIITPSFDITLSHSLSLYIEQRRFIRFSHYKYFPDVNFSTFDSRISLRYKL